MLDNDDINQEILYFLDINDKLNLIAVNGGTRTVFVSHILYIIDESFKGYKIFVKSNNLIFLFLKLIEKEEMGLAKYIIRKIYNIDKRFFPFLFEKILNSENLLLIQLFFSETPPNFVWNYNDYNTIRKIGSVKVYLTYYRNLLLALIKTKQVELIEIIIIHLNPYEMYADNEETKVINEHLGILIEIGQIMIGKHKLDNLLVNTKQNYHGIKISELIDMIK